MTRIESRIITPSFLFRCGLWVMAGSNATISSSSISQPSITSHVAYIQPRYIVTNIDTFPSKSLYFIRVLTYLFRRIQSGFAERLKSPIGRLESAVSSVFLGTDSNPIFDRQKCWKGKRLHWFHRAIKIEATVADHRIGTWACIREHLPVEFLLGLHHH